MQIQSLLTPDGHLADFNSWTPEVAHALATKEALVLTDAHWAVLTWLREYYQQYQTHPLMRHMVTALQTTHGDTITSTYLHQLFPGGPLPQAGKLAGLPASARCI